MLSQTKLLHKRQKKEAKRNLKRKGVRTYLNKLLGLGPEKRNQALHHAQRTAGIKVALINIDAMIKKWNDKISLELLTKVQNQKIILRQAMKSKDAEAIQQAVNDFVPLNQEVIDIVKKFDSPVENIATP